MFKNSHAFSSFSVDDIEKAKTFYAETLELAVEEIPEMGLLTLKLPGGGKCYDLSERHAYTSLIHRP